MKGKDIEESITLKLIVSPFVGVYVFFVVRGGCALFSVSLISWEQRKLGDLGTTFTGLSGKSKEDFGHGDAQFVTYMNVFTNPVSDTTMTEHVEIDNHQSKVQYGDVFFTTSSETPDEVGMSSVWLGNTDNIYLNSFCFGYRPEVNFDPYYMAYMLRSDVVRKNIIFLAQGISRYNISKNRVMDIEVPVPSLAEQKKIGSYFKNLDHLITLHQSKLFEHNKKKTCQFMISWEQRKLGSVFEEYSEKNHEELPPLTIIQGGGTVLREESDRALQYDKTNLSGYKMVRKDDFIVHLRTFEGGLEKAHTNGIISPAYHTFHGENTDSRFYYSFFRSRRFIDVLLKPHVYGIRDGKSIDIEGMKTIKIPVPIYDEQKRIGDYFESIDRLITLHQSKLSYYRNRSIWYGSF